MDWHRNSYSYTVLKTHKRKKVQQAMAS